MQRMSAQHQPAPQRPGSVTDTLNLLKHKLPSRGLLLAALIPLFGMVTAYGIAPDTNTRDIPLQTLVQELSLPQVGAENTGNNSQTFHHEVSVLPGETLTGLLSRLGATEADAALLLSQGAASIARELRANQRIQANVSDQGQLIDLSMTDRNGEQLRVHRQGDNFALEHVKAVLETRTVIRSGRIENSLFAATEAAGLPDSVAVKIADIFGTQLDFRSDLRKGDTFSVVYEINYRNGEPVGEGKVLAAEYVNAGKPYQAVLYHNANGQEAYYTPKGESLKKGFLRSPLEFTRVTSSFSNSRLHPVLGYHRAHTGVDFGAPIGARVKAVGDATVSFAGRKGGYGNLVILRHHNGYETYYAHLNGFAKGLRRGSAVSQGDIIGYVGRSGTATGPHLHYEIRIGGIPRNPVAIKLPGAAPLAAAQKARFNQQTAGQVQRLELLRGSNLAALD